MFFQTVFAEFSLKFLEIFIFIWKYFSVHGNQALERALHQANPQKITKKKSKPRVSALKCAWQKIMKMCYGK